MVKDVKNLDHYLRKGTLSREKRMKKINEIINIVGGEPTQYTQVVDMCIDYTLKILRANPNELENMSIFNMKKEEYNPVNSKEIRIKPTYDERRMLEYISQKTFIKNFADIYSYTLSCVAQMESEIEGDYE